MKKIRLKFLPLFIVALCIGSIDARADTQYINRNTAVVRIMNKAAGKAQTVSIPVGRATEFEKLDIIVRACRETPPFEMRDFFMFVEIGKRGANAPRLFSGWMTATEPGDNPLQDADYDLWLVQCE